MEVEYWEHKIVKKQFIFFIVVPKYVQNDIRFFNIRSVFLIYIVFYSLEQPNWIWFKKFEVGKSKQVYDHK